MRQAGLRFAQGDLLFKQLSFRAFAFGDVDSRPDVFNEFARFTENGMACSMKVFDLASRENDSEVKVGISPFRLFGFFKPSCPILRMNSLENSFIGWYACLRIKPKQVVTFRRPVGDLFRGRFQRPTPAFAQRLRFR
jgi:hypothetical protein